MSGTTTKRRTLTKDVYRSYGENNINCGRPKEFSNISIDRFIDSELEATMFILTHCHTDHMVGLDEDEFWYRLQEPGIKLYMSKYTSILLPLFHRYLRGADGIKQLIQQEKLVILELNKMYSVEDPATKRIIKLTFLRAGHCPGSVMILFEFEHHTILYTGDCRLSVQDLQSFDALHRIVGKERFLKPISHLYLDTTFCSSKSQDFPGRADCLDELVNLVKLWFQQKPTGFVRLSFSARFSHEHVIVRLKEVFRSKIHVSSERYEAYQSIPSLIDAITLNPDSKIHFCDNKDGCIKHIRSLMRESGKKLVLTIRLSSLWFMEDKHKAAVAYDKYTKYLTVCYSMHSSLDEITNMVNYLQPKVVTPLVLPKNMERDQLKRQLLRSAKGNFVYEDYVQGKKFDGLTKLDVQNMSKKDEIVVEEEQNSVEFIATVLAESKVKTEEAEVITIDSDSDNESCRTSGSETDFEDEADDLLEKFCDTQISLTTKTTSKVESSDCETDFEDEGMGNSSASSLQANSITSPAIANRNPSKRLNIQDVVWDYNFSPSPKKLEREESSQDRDNDNNMCMRKYPKKLKW